MTYQVFPTSPIFSPHLVYFSSGSVYCFFFVVSYATLSPLFIFHTSLPYCCSYFLASELSVWALLYCRYSAYTPPIPPRTHLFVIFKLFRKRKYQWSSGEEEAHQLLRILSILNLHTTIQTLHILRPRGSALTKALASISHHLIHLQNSDSRKTQEYRVIRNSTTKTVSGFRHPLEVTSYR